MPYIRSDPAAILIIALALNIAAGLAAYLKKTVSASGLAAGVAVGTVIFYSGGPGCWCVMGAFVVSSSLLSGYRRGVKKTFAHIQEKGARRDWMQVLANGGTGCAMILLHRITGEPVFLLLFAVAFASSNADTWASEIGPLGRKPPLGILSLREVPRGASGGVSAPGLLASLTGAAFIALTHLGAAALFSGGMDLPVRQLPWIIAGGFTGSVIDSVLGATVQAQYYCEATESVTERRMVGGIPTRRVRGAGFINNDTVNFLSSLLAVMAVLLFLRLLPCPGI